MGTRPFPYPGSKAMIAEWVIDHMIDHEKFVEGMGGAAAVLTTKPKSEVEVYNDLDGSLATFFRVLRHQPDDLKEWLDNCPLSREQHEEWATQFYVDGDTPEDDVEHAGRFFFLRFSQWNGKHGQKTAFQHRGGRKAKEFRRAADRLPEFAERYNDVVVEQMDFTEIIDEYDGDSTLFYFDPDLRPDPDDSLFNEKFSFPRDEFIRAVESIDGYWMVSLLEESIPDEWRNNDGIWFVDTEYRSYHEHLAMNYDPANVPKFEGVNEIEVDALETW